MNIKEMLTCCNKQPSGYYTGGVNRISVGYWTYTCSECGSKKWVDSRGKMYFDKQSLEFGIKI